MASRTLNIRGMKLRTATRRRYIIVVPWRGEVSAFGYSDSYDSAHKRAARQRGRYEWIAVVDTNTGEEV